MKRVFLLFLLAGMILSSCGSLEAELQENPSMEPSPEGAQATPTSTVEVGPQPSEAPTEALSSPEWLSDALTYSDPDAGFALQVPAGWFVIDVAPEIKKQSFAYSVTIQSWDSSGQGTMGIPEGESKMDVSVIKSGVHAPETALELRRQELANAGQTLLNEEQWILQDGWIAYRLKVEDSFGVSNELVTARQGLTIILAGLGDQELLLEMYHTLRQIGPGWQTTGLPQPVLFLRSDDLEPVAPGSQNIWRVDPDGTLSQLTDEAFSLTSFAVSPVDGAITFSALGENVIYRMDADGSARIKLFQGPDLTANPDPDQGSQITNLAWSPDGTQIAFAMDGVYQLSAGGGEPVLLMANQAPPEVEIGAQRLYSPLSFSPDGKKLLAWEAIGQEQSSYAVLDLADAQVVSLGPGNFCCDPAWSPDSGSFTFSNANFGMLIPGLWRADAGSGEVVMVIRGYDGYGFPGGTGKSMQLFRGVRQSEDGAYYGFAASGTYEDLFLDEEGNERAPRLRLSRISPDGQDVEELRPEPFPVAQVLWAPDESGALLTLAGDQTWPAGTLLWLPLKGDPMVLAEGAYQPQWGR